MRAKRKNESRVSAGKWRIRHILKPDDLDSLVRLHGMLYAEEYGFDKTFETYVADGLAELTGSPRPEKNRLWLAEMDDRMVGCIAIVARPGNEAQLRWFLVKRDQRRLGIGTELMEKALRFSRKQGFKTVFLWTTSELDAARRVYMRFGFGKTEEKTHTIWGKAVTEERYELRIP